MIRCMLFNPCSTWLTPDHCNAWPPVNTRMQNQVQCMCDLWPKQCMTSLHTEMQNQVMCCWIPAKQGWPLIIAMHDLCEHSVNTRMQNQVQCTGWPLNIAMLDLYHTLDCRIRSWAITNCALYGGFFLTARILGECSTIHSCLRFLESGD